MAGSRKFPLPSFRFDVQIDIARSKGRSSFNVGFQEITGLGATVEFKESSSNGENNLNLKIPMKVKPSDVKFKKGVFKGKSTAHDLMKSFGLYGTEFNCNTPYASITITLKDEASQGVMAWTLDQAYPSSWEFGALNAMSSEVLLETITFSCRSMKMRYL